METLEFRAQFKNELPVNHPRAEYIILANYETARLENSVYVVVEDITTKEVILNLSINCAIPETFYRGVTFIDSCLVIAVESYIYMFNLKTRENFQFKIDGFFDSFCIEEDLLLVRSDTHITCIDRNNKVIWNSERVPYNDDFMKVLTHFPNQNSHDWDAPQKWFKLEIHNLEGLYLKN